MKPDWQELIAQADRVGVSAISLFEVAWLVHNKRIELGCDLAWWFDQALALSDVELLAVTPEIAMCAVSLEAHHSDPQDRLIIASAIEHQAELMTVDHKFKLYRELDGLLIQA